MAFTFRPSLLIGLELANGQLGSLTAAGTPAECFSPHQPPSQPPHCSFTANPAGRHIRTLLTTGRCDGGAMAVRGRCEGGAMVVRWWCKGGVMVVRWWCEGGAMAVRWDASLNDWCERSRRWRRLITERPDQAQWARLIWSSEACEGQTRGETQWRAQGRGCCRHPLRQSQMIRRDFDQWNARFKFSRPSSEAENMVFRPSVVNWSHWIKILIQNLMFTSKYRVVQRASRGHPALFCFGDTRLKPLIHCCGIQMYNYHWFHSGMLMSKILKTRWVVGGPSGYPVITAHHYLYFLSSLPYPIRGTPPCVRERPPVSVRHEEREIIKGGKQQHLWLSL